MFAERAGGRGAGRLEEIQDYRRCRRCAKPQVVTFYIGTISSESAKTKQSTNHNEHNNNRRQE